MRTITWEEAEQRYPECSPAAERDRMDEHIGDVDAWTLVELQAFQSEATTQETSLWIFVGDEHRARYNVASQSWEMHCDGQRRHVGPHTLRVHDVGGPLPFRASCSCGYSSHHTTAPVANQYLEGHLSHQRTIRQPPHRARIKHGNADVAFGQSTVSFHGFVAACDDCGWSAACETLEVAQTACVTHQAQPQTSADGL